jgi:hypothetical protein
MQISSIKSVKPLGFQWETENPFLFCVHHKDAYPKANSEMETGKPNSVAGHGHERIRYMIEAWVDLQNMPTEKKKSGIKIINERPPHYILLHQKRK